MTGSKKKITGKQIRKAPIKAGSRKKGKKASAIAWATVNKESSGGLKGKIAKKKSTTKSKSIKKITKSPISKLKAAKRSIIKKISSKTKKPSTIKKGSSLKKTATKMKKVAPKSKTLRKKVTKKISDAKRRTSHSLHRKPRQTKRSNVYPSNMARKRHPKSNFRKFMDRILKAL